VTSRQEMARDVLAGVALVAALWLIAFLAGVL
jgi:hypothetical protein